MKLARICCLLLVSTLPAHAQVVVLAHPASGDFVVVHNRPGALAEAMQRANAKKPGGGWRPLLNSTVPGYGAMFCFRPKGGGEMRYFIAEGKASGAEAIVDARTQANAAASGTGAATAGCGNWNNRNLHPLQAPPLSRATTPPAGTAHGSEGPHKKGEGGVIETIKQQVREQVTCDPKKKPCPPPAMPASSGVRG